MKIHRYNRALLLHPLLFALAAVLALALPSLGMNKADLIDAIAKDAGISKADAKRALEGFINASGSALKKGDRISLVGFGTFSVSKRAARTGRNPQTGKEIKIASKNVVKFKAGRDFSDKVKAFAGDVPPEFQKFVAEFFPRHFREGAQELVGAFLDDLRKTGAGVGEIDAFDSASLDGDNGIACSLTTALQEEGVRPATAARSLDSLVEVLNAGLARGETSTIEGFGTFTTDGGLAIFEPELQFGLSIIVGLHDQSLELITHELTHVVQQSSRISQQAQLVDNNKKYLTADLDRDGLSDLVASCDKIWNLVDGFGDKPLMELIVVACEPIASLEEDYYEFYDKGDKAAGKRVRKGMQELKNLAQDIRKEVQEIKNKDR